MELPANNKALIQAADEYNLGCYGVIPGTLCRLPPNYVVRYSVLVPRSRQAMVTHSSFMPQNIKLLVLHWIFLHLTSFQDGGHRWMNGGHWSMHGQRFETCRMTNACRCMVCVLRFAANFLESPSIEEAAPLPGDAMFHYGSVDDDLISGHDDVHREFLRARGSTGCEMLMVGLDDAWRPVEDPPFQAFHMAPIAFAGGLIMLWLMEDDDDPLVPQEYAPRGFARFDEEKEAFLVTELRKECRATTEHAGVAELSGELCYWERYDWEPVAAWRGEIVTSDGRCQFPNYNRKAKSFDQVKASVPYGRAMVYTGTLVSPKTLLMEAEGAQARWQRAQVVASMFKHPNLW